MSSILSFLYEHGIRPTPQRMAVAEYVLQSTSHPSADEVLKVAQRTFPTISRGTVYNTLNLFVTMGLLSIQILKEGTVVFDPNMEEHHHFIDEESGEVYDIPREAVRVTGVDSLKDYEVTEYQVVIKGRRITGGQDQTG